MSNDRHMQLLGPVDSAFWFLDTPETPMNIGSVLIFDGQIDFEMIVNLIDSRLHQAPLYMQKVISAPLNLGEPIWIYDREFHIFNHVFRRRLSAPGDEQQLIDMAGNIMSRRLRRDKPLWELYVINGLANDRTALMFKVHHCMVDGISAIDLFSMMMDFSPEMPEIAPKPPYDPPPEPTPFELLQLNTRMGLAYRAKLLRRIGGDVANIGINLFDRRQRKNVLMGLLSLVHDNLTTINPLPINGENSGKLTLAWADFSLDDVLAIRRQERVSVNDIMLTILGMAIERYSHEMDEDIDQDFVRMIIPVNLRDGMMNDADEYAGNRISLLPIEVPFDTLDVLTCLQQVSSYAKVMKDSELAKNFDIALSLPALVHPTMQPLIWSAVPGVFSSLAHTWCTNVAGPAMEMYLLGRQMIKAYGYLPNNPSMGLANTVLSYNGRITLTIAADVGIIADVQRLRNHVIDVYRELCEATGIGLDALDDVAEMKTEPAEPSVSHNGVHAQADSAGEQVSTPLVESDAGSVAVTTEIKLMSEEWAQALQVDLNNSDAYYKASTRWTMGPVAMIMKASPENGFPRDQAVLLDLHKGRCRDAHNVAVPTARQQATIVLEATYDNWMDVLERRAKAFPMILRGNIKLEKGSIRQLMPFTKSSSELVRSAIRVTQK